MRKKKILPIICISALIAVMLVFFCTDTKIYETQAQYKEAGGIIPYEIPEGASDCRYAIYRSALSKAYLYSFVPDAEYLETFPVQTDAEWYGRQVQDYNAGAHEFNRIPLSLPFSSVTDTPIEAYGIIAYNPAGTGTRSYGVLADTESGRIVVFYFRTAK